jgi:hypothetical protein
MILEIAGNYPEDIIVNAGGPSKLNGKYVGWITRGPESHCRPLLSTEAIFDTPAQAKEAMQNIVDYCIDEAEKNLSDNTNPITQFLSSPEGQIVQDIVAESKKPNS